jgi:hypothetical protein
MTSTITKDQLRSRSTGTASDEMADYYLDRIRALEEEVARLRAELDSRPGRVLEFKVNHNGHLGAERIGE